MRTLAGVAALVIVVPAVLLAAAAGPKVIELAITGGTLTPSQRVIRVQQGDEVVLRWTADAPLTLHLHGYDIERKVAPGAPATMPFRARATGRFPITVHGLDKGREATLGYLEVHPQ